MKFSYLLIIVCVLFGCKNPDDVSPVIRSISVNDQDESHFLVIAGEEMIVKIETSDNKQLKQVMLKLTTMNGLHNHSQSTNEPVPFFRQLNKGNLDTTMTKKIEGAENIQNFNLIIPDSINGAWKMTVGLLDENGNYLSKDYTLHVHNSNIPSALVSAVYPVANSDGTVELTHADSLPSFRINGFMVDHTGFDYIKASLYRGTTVNWTNEWSFNDGTWSFDLTNIVINEILSSGTYTLQTESADTSGWVSIYRGTIKIP